MKEEAKTLIQNGIDMLPVYFNKKDGSADFAFNLIMGKIAGFVEIGLITMQEMDQFVDAAIHKYEEMK